MGKVRIICAYHPKYFGYELIIREEDWPGQAGDSHGICADCSVLVENDCEYKEPDE